MELLLIRHARPARVDASTAADPDLTDEGRDQAAALAAFLAAHGRAPVDAIVSSPMRRAVATAEPLAAALGLGVDLEDDLAEFDRDHPTYIPVEEYAGDRRRQWEELLAGRWMGRDIDLMGFQKRVCAALDRIIEDHPSQNVAVVCHGGVINAFLARMLQMPGPMFFQPDYTSLTRVLASSSGERMLRSANETPHLQVVGGTLSATAVVPGRTP